MTNRRNIYGAIILLSTVSSASADPLDIILQLSPDVFSSFLDVTYDAGLQKLLVHGPAMSYFDGATDANITSGNFDIDLTVTNGGLATGGTLTITGTVAGMGPNLLSGTISDFGFANAPGGEILEFLFTGTGGDMLPLFGGAAAPIGTILDIQAPGAFNGTWNNSWNNTGGTPGAGGGTADTAPPVPEPTTLALLTLGVACLIRRTRS